MSDAVVIQICKPLIPKMCIRGLYEKFPAILNISRTGHVTLDVTW